MMKKLALIAAGLMFVGLTAAADEAGWREVLTLTGAKLPEGTPVAELLGPLPGDSALAASGCLPPAAWAEKYQRADEGSRRDMRRVTVARLRDLGRWGLVKPAGVDQLLGREGPGARGSEFFGIPPIPGDAYRALVYYIEYAAARVPGGGYSASEADAARIDRALQAALALSSPEVRAQYHDFDVVWSNVMKDLDCAGPKKSELLPGVLWLYAQLRTSVGLDFLPAVPPDLQKKVDQESGKLFTAAREEAASLPDSLAALTCWQCPAP
jgi:hypothetical protein